MCYFLTLFSLQIYVSGFLEAAHRNIVRALALIPPCIFTPLIKNNWPPPTRLVLDTFWVATSAWANFQIAGNCSLLSELYPSLVTNYWDKMYTPNFSEEYGCYWHQADREGEENSVGGDGCRPVSNSVMYSEAAALQNIATAIGNSTAAAEWGEQAAFWQQVVLGKLWSDDLDFFVTLTVPKPSSGQSIVNTRFNYSTSTLPLFAF